MINLIILRQFLIIVKVVFAFVLLINVTQPVNASHLVGGELEVNLLDSNQYEVTLNYYLDCDGNPQAFSNDLPITVNYSSNNCNENKSTNLAQIKNTGKDIAPICASATSSCDGGVTRGIERYIFRDTVTLSKCSDWVFSWTEVARSQAITTIQNPGNANIHLEAEIDNKNFPDNNAPTFTNPPLAFVCKGQDNVYNQGAVDPEGDSLLYSLFKPKTGANGTVTYNAGFSSTQPLKSTPPVSIDSTTGDISFNANQVDVTVLGVKVEEFDSSGNRKSVILRDIQLDVRNCPSSSNAPSLAGFSDSAGGFDTTNKNFDTTLCPGQPITLYVNAKDPDKNDSLFMDWNGAISGANFQVIGDSTNTPTGKFTWTPPNPTAGKGIQRNTFTVNLRDNACPYFTTISRGYVVNVVPSKTVDLGDTAYVACDDSLKLKPVVKGASADSNLTFDWSTGAKGDSTYIQEPGKYAVTVKDSGNCPITDSITVLPSLNPSYKISSSFAANRGCVRDSVQFTDSSTSEKAVVNSWDWDFDDGDTSDLQNPRHKFTDTGDYDVQLIIADTNDCQDTLNQAIAIDSKPQASFSVKPSCSRDTTVFTGQSNVGKGTIFKTNWDFGDGDSSQQVSPRHVYDTGAQYSASLVTKTVGGCEDTTKQTFRINPTPQADFTSDNTCKGLQTQFTELATIEPEDSVTSYQWQLRPGLTTSSSNPKTTYSTEGTYNVSLTVTSSNGCSDDIQQPININPQPTISTLADTTFCSGDSVKLATTISPSSSTTLFEENFDGGIQSSNWLSTSLGSAGSYCGTQSGSDALYFDGDGSDRKAITKDLDTRKADTLTFYFKYGTDNNNFPFPTSGCDAIESGDNEEVSLAYSTDGGSTWNTIQTLSEVTYSQSNFKKVTITLPTNAKQASTRFRWKQNSYNNCNSGLFGTRCFDNWAMDAVKITNQVDYQFSWTPNSGLGDSSALSPKAKTNNTTTYSITVKDTGFNCTLKDSVKLTPQTVTAAFKSSAPVCEYTKAKYTDQSTIRNGNLTASLWDFGDGDSAVAVNPTHRFPANGGYDVQLVRESAIGCKDSITQTDSIYTQPTAGFTFDTACLGEATNFTDLASVSTDTVSQYDWRFGTAGSSNKANPSFAFGSADSFEVTQIAGSSQGCKDTLSQFIDVGGVPKADFQMKAVCEQTEKVFRDQSSVSYDSLVQWQWDFGDGSTAKAVDPRHTYDSNGNYQVQLTVTSNFNCTDSIQKNQPVNPNPVTRFGVPDSAQCLRGNLFQMNNATSIDSGQLQFSWAFGDSTTSTQPSPTHTYADTGNYTVSLIAESQQACADTSSLQLTVHPMPSAVFSVADGAQCLTGNQFQFNGKSTISRGSLSQAWDFGDGDSSSLKAPNHTYKASGTYQVALVATSDKVCRDTAMKNIRVNPKPEPSFAYTQDSAQCLRGNGFLFTSTSTIDTGNLNFNWSFDDGDQAVSDSAFHSYNNSGNYDVQLRTRSDSGCLDSTARQVTVHPAPQASIDVIDSAQCLDLNRFNLQNNSSILKGNLSYQWQFGNGLGDSTVQPVVIYDTASNFTVRMVAESSKGCFDTAFQGLTVHPEPAASFEVKDQAQCLRGNQFQFTDQTQLRNGSLTYDWRLGDGTSSSKASPVHTYQRVDTFNVSQIVQSNKGCLDTALSAVYTSPMPDAQISVNEADQCLDPNLFAFSNSTSISQGNLSYAWFFDDSATSSKAAPSHKYDDAGSYEPYLVATSDSGCRDTASLQVDVAPQTNVAFSVNDSLQCNRDHRFSFVNESSRPTSNIDFFWFFGDGNTERGETASHIYDTTGAFEVRLATTTADGCKDTLLKTVFVKPHPSANFKADRGCAGKALAFKDQSSIQSGKLSEWSYQFGDGDSASSPNPTHVYASGGTYDASLVVTSNFGCLDSTAQEVKIYRKPTEPQVIKATTTPAGHNVLSWEGANTPIPSFYRLERSTEDGPFTELTILNEDLRQYRDTAVDVEAKTYSYQIQMVDSCRNEGPFNRPPHQPIQLNADEGEGEPELEWKGYRGWPVNFYQVQIANPDGEGFKTIITYDELLPSRRQLIDTFSTLEPGKLCYRIVGVKADSDTAIRTSSNISCIDPTVRLFVPNAFSPNGDGLNDRFRVKGTFLSTVTIQVYSRWGEQVYISNSLEEGWDGTFKGEKLPAGIYTYIINAQGADGDFIEREGTVTIVR